MRLTGEAVLIARTVPELTKDGTPTVCSVWWEESYGLFRLYPLDIKWTLTQWGTYQIDCRRNKRDGRHESWRVERAPVPVDTTELGKSTNKKKFVEALPTLTAASIDALNIKRCSLGVIKPIGLSMNWEYDKSQDPAMLRLFTELEPQHAGIGRNSYPHRPRLIFTDASGSHNLSFNEWGSYEFLRKGHPHHELAAALKLDDPDRDYALVVGNMNHQRNAWLVIHCISWVRDQPTLFDTTPVTGKVRVETFTRCGNVCLHCGATEDLTIDHIVPRVRGGTNDPENLQVLCRSCNSKKGDRMPQELAS